MAVNPVQLGWHTPRADYLAGYTVFIPVGEWELGGDDNTGLGMWSTLPGGTTLRLTPAAGLIHSWRAMSSIR
jgi:hypothetical protein